MATAQSVRMLKEAEKQARADYLSLRVEETEDLNTDILERIAELRSVLAHTLSVDDCISFATLRPATAFERFVPPEHLWPDAFAVHHHFPQQTSWQQIFPGSATSQSTAIAAFVAKIRTEAAEFAEHEAFKAAKLASLQSDYDARKSAFEQRVSLENADIDEFESSYFAKAQEAVVAYNEMVLTRSEYPLDGFPQTFRIAYDAVGGVMVVEYDLPQVSVVPSELEYRYVKTKDTIEPKARKAADIKQIYQQLIAEIALRTLHEVFEADQGKAIAILTFTGILDTYDPASGHDVRIPVLSVRATKESFLQLRLERIDALACLRSLGASVSAKPDELLAVKPIIEFNMVDKRFIDQGDALSGLESRPNLMELSPTDFEVLVANLFGKMGLETKLTRSSRDGGVDAIAFDARPVLGGKVVIQAKRYHGTVGVSAVRDLYGTMMNEGANKGILVTTSRYGSDAYTFASDKPIELIDGSALLYLLREHAGIDARIVATM